MTAKQISGIGAGIITPGIALLSPEAVATESPKEQEGLGEVLPRGVFRTRPGGRPVQRWRFHGEDAGMFPGCWNVDKHRRSPV